LSGRSKASPQVGSSSSPWARSRESANIIFLFFYECLAYIPNKQAKLGYFVNFEVRKNEILIKK
jgi:hypothetical protein